MADSHVLLYRANDRVEANLLAFALDNAGIRVDLAGGMSHLIYGDLGAAEALSTDLWVRREDYGRGRQVIEDFHSEIGRNVPSTIMWTYKSCGEINDNSFEVCWRCQASSPGRIT
jgi:hypothetical protein